MGILLQGNNFWVPGENNHNLFYMNEAREKGIELGGWSFGAQFGDLNNDGSQDLYLVNGFISGKKGSSYWYDYSKVTGGNKTIISDAKNWPALKGRSLAGYQNDILWLNDGSGIFQDVTSKVSPEFSVDGRAVAFADLWNRGVLDIIISSQNSPLIILQNHVNPEQNWIDFDLTGDKSNRDAIGARVDVYWDGKMQSQVVTAGIGFCSENQHRLHFGIGKKSTIDKAIIRWPSGMIQTIVNPKPGMYHQVFESH